MNITNNSKYSKDSQTIESNEEEEIEKNTISLKPFKHETLTSQSKIYNNNEINQLVIANNTSSGQISKNRNLSNFKKKLNTLNFSGTANKLEKLFNNTNSQLNTSNNLNKTNTNAINNIVSNTNKINSKNKSQLNESKNESMSNFLNNIPEKEKTSKSKIKLSTYLLKNPQKKFYNKFDLKGNYSLNYGNTLFKNNSLFQSIKEEDLLNCSISKQGIKNIVSNQISNKNQYLKEKHFIANFTPNKENLNINDFSIQSSNFTYTNEVNQKSNKNKNLLTTNNFSLVIPNKINLIKTKKLSVCQKNDLVKIKNKFLTIKNRSKTFFTANSLFKKTVKINWKKSDESKVNIDFLENSEIILYFNYLKLLSEKTGKYYAIDDFQKLKKLIKEIKNFNEALKSRKKQKTEKIKCFLINIFKNKTEKLSKKLILRLFSWKKIVQNKKIINNNLLIFNGILSKIIRFNSFYIKKVIFNLIKKEKKEKKKKEFSIFQTGNFLIEKEEKREVSFVLENIQLEILEQVKIEKLIINE